MPRVVTPDVAWTITRLVMLRGGLPQGSPTSTIVANLVIVNLGNRISGVAYVHNASYSQFVDDGAFSGSAYIKRLQRTIERIIRQEHLSPSPKPEKRTVTYRNTEQTVTGIKFNSCIDVPSEKLRRVRAELEEIRKDVDSRSMPSEKRIASIRGKIQHIANLNPGAGKSLFRKLARIERQCLASVAC